MARQKSLLASQGLEDLHAPLPTSSVSQAQPSPTGDLEPSSSANMPSLTRRVKSKLINYPCRLRADQVQALNHLRDTLGVLPADLIRDFVDLGLRRVKEEGVQRP